MPKASTSAALGVPQRAHPYRRTSAPLADATNTFSFESDLPVGTSFAYDFRNGWDDVTLESLVKGDSQYLCPIGRGCKKTFTERCAVQKHILALEHVEDVMLPILWVCPHHNQPYANPSSLGRHTKLSKECAESLAKWCSDNGISHKKYMSIGYRGIAPETTAAGRKSTSSGSLWERRHDLTVLHGWGSTAQAVREPGNDYHDDAEVPNMPDTTSAGAEDDDSQSVAQLDPVTMEYMESLFCLPNAVEVIGDASEVLHDALDSLEGDTPIPAYDVSLRF
ncbi:hypothetical protein EXIGLDRAFT_778163 [Exidia glandulosa HHB12029]|uniref:Uncharacterized protein n=1 Tax=Exidia glandulosa HHB12029 TaxID=1314781 RepID=A0A165CNZ3_EXIGL|nr:hypothetical protein EXIGLDRAFT_778163 [Exidia glandulosa HHB12029]